MTGNKYRGLKGIYYEAVKHRDLESYRKMVDSRRNNELAVHTGLTMAPLVNEFRTSDQFEIFYLPALQISQLEEEIFTLSHQIDKKMALIPEVAQEQIFNNNLVDELQSTNDIEGVKSSKEEISQTFERLKKSQVGKERFSGLVKLYANFEEKKYNTISSVKDFRDIWDELVSQEISTEDQPDGKLFRKANEVIQTSEKVIHRGDESEEEITNDLSKLVAEMNNPNIPSLPKCFLAHYYFEYIHPFYDGNGRTGRFIVCSYLSRKLDRMSALQFSTAIAKNRNSYYKAFVEMSNVYNQGEGTKFVIKMMQLLIFGQYNIIDKLDNGIKLLENAKRLIAKLKLNSNEKEIMFALCQKAIFGPYVGTITDTDLSNTLKISRYLLNKAFEVLIANDFVEVASSKPLSHVITKKIRDQLFCLETFL